MFMKRLLVCYALCGVYYSETTNAEQLGDLWPYPIAAVLGHGSRVLIRLEDVESSEFLNYLLAGDPKIVDWKESRVPKPIEKRIAATHSVELKDTGQIIERKLRVTNVTEAVGCIRGNHMGINLPIGGAGNSSPLGPNCLVTFRGEVMKMGVSSAPSMLSRFWRKSEEATPASAPSGHFSEASEMSSSSKVSREDREWKVERRVQSGHLYIRTDDFGEVACSRSSIMVVDPNTDAADRFKTDKDTAHLRMVKARHSGGVLAGMPGIPSGEKSRSAATRALGQVSLLRMNSEPDLAAGANEGASAEDIVWVGQALVARSNLPLSTPPSAVALKMLIEHYDPVHANLYGIGSFKSIQTFRKELASGESLLARSHKGGLQRFCQPVILQLRFRGARGGHSFKGRLFGWSTTPGKRERGMKGSHVLMKMGETRDNTEELISRPTFAVGSAGPTEHWRAVVMRILSDKLCVGPGLIEALTPAAKREQDCLTVPLGSGGGMWEVVFL
eukprot:g18369.t1